MSSQNYSGTSVILNRVERYKPENFQIVKLGDRAWVSRSPDDVSPDMLAKETIKHHIRSSGSYMLSPFAFNWNQHCIALESKNNLVRLASGKVVPWGSLALEPGPQDGSISVQTGIGTYEPIVHVFHNGVKEVHQWTLSNGRVIDCTWNHNFLTRKDGVEVEMHISDIYDQRLPLLFEDFIEEEHLPENLEYPSDLQPGEGIKQVQGFEGRYGITNFGRVWAFNKTVSYRDGRKPRVFPAKWMAPYPHPKGYLQTMFTLGRDENGKQITKWFLIHQLVGTHFLTQREDLPFLNHKDRDRKNNYATNLEWCNTPYNQDHYWVEDKKSFSSSFVGVSKEKDKWRAFADSPLTGKTIYIASFPSEQEAAEAYDDYVESQGWHKAPYFKRLNRGGHEENDISVDLHTELYIVKKESLGEMATGDIQVGYDRHLYLLNGVKVHNSQIYSIVAIFKELSNSINLSSCRVDAIANDPGLAQLIKYFGSTNLPTAVEGVSNRVRNFLQKSITEDELYKGMNYIVETDFQEIKIYMIYTGLETQSDFDEWERFLKYITELKRKYNRPLLPIRVSFTPLFSTLGTPTQYHGSKVSKSMKMAVPPIFNLKKISNRYDIGIRMSASVDSSDFGQLMDFLDRRGQPLIEYGSLCGFAPFNRAQVILSLNPREITKDEYSELPSKIRWEKDGKFWTCPETRKFTMNGVYDLMMDGSLYPDLPVTDFAKFIYSLDGKTVPELFMSWMVPSVRRLFEGRGKVTVIRSESDEYVRTTPAGFKQFIARMNMSIGNLQVAHMKELLPVMTNGQTFEDIISDKSAFTVFPSQHVSSGETRSYTKYFAQYALNLVGLTELYCLSSRLAQCLHCLDLDTTMVTIEVED